MLFNSPAITGVKNAKTEHQLVAAQERIAEINSKLSKASKTTPANKPKHDWAASYQNWGAFEDTEELQQNAAKEEAKMQSLIEQTDNLGHYHDHSKERSFFEQSETDKFQSCEDNRHMGNYLFGEGLYTKAAEHYQIAIAYYEYCFPEDQATQSNLDNLRRACLCNISLCYLRLGYLRPAVESASIVLKETDGKHSKALFRRAQAYRELDEYELAIADLKRAGALAPSDSAIALELSLVKALSVCYIRNKREFAESMLGVSAGSSDNAHSESIGKIHERDHYTNHTHSHSHEGEHSGDGDDDLAEACCSSVLPLEPICVPAVSALAQQCIGIGTTSIYSP